MVTVRTIVHTCDRCIRGNEKTAVTERKFVIDGLGYKLELCEQHGDAFDRDLGVWIQLAQDIDNPFAGTKSSTMFTKEDNERQRSVLQQSDEVRRNTEQSIFAKKQAERLAEEAEHEAYNKIPGAKIWTLTRHARERMMERNFTVAEVLMTVTMPATRVPDLADPSETLCIRDRCIAVVNPRTHVIITIRDRDEEMANLSVKATQQQLARSHA